MHDFINCYNLEASSGDGSGSHSLRSRDLWVKLQNGTEFLGSIVYCRVNRVIFLSGFVANWRGTSLGGERFGKDGFVYGVY